MSTVETIYYVYQDPERGVVDGEGRVQTDGGVAPLNGYYFGYELLNYVDQSVAGQGEKQ